jgi:non-ribosomal peptide synthetase component E (peptide arylation enzyme)
MWPTHPPAPERAAHYRAIGAWRDRPVGRYLSRAAALWPDALAVVDGARRLTFAEVDRRATELAAALHARGIGQDDVVSFQLPVEGRIKDVVNRAGEKISVREVENLLGEHPAVAEVAVVAGPDARTGERACEFIVTGPGQELTLKEIGEHLTGREVAAQKIPESLFLVDALPYTTSGKVRKFALREWLRDRAGASGAVAGMTVRAVDER